MSVSKSRALSQAVSKGGALGTIISSTVPGVKNLAEYVQATDPTINVNPSEVGVTWINSTTGSMFVCIDNTTDENTWFEVNEDLTTISTHYLADCLIVAGGGSGGGAVGASVGAGGGAGGLIYKKNFVVVPGTVYSISIGAGGASTSGQINGNAGDNTTAFGLTAIGGGYGGTWGESGGNGGSGGGGGGRELFTNNSYGGSGTANQGHNGGNPTVSSGTSDDSSGGGGGAGGPGFSAHSFRGGDGGFGLAIDIEGNTSTTYYASGGGGGTEDGDRPGAAFPGGGGYGGSIDNNVQNGAANTGGGGGGASGTDGDVSGAGGSGVVILRVLTTNAASATTGSPTITTDGDYTIYKFTGSGSITF